MALRAIGVLALLLFLVHSARADTFAFDFVSTGSVGAGLPDPVSGGGSFETVPFDEFPGGSVITSLTGELDGQPMDLVSGGLNDADQFSGYAQDQLLFTVDGATYSIFEGDEPPVAGYQLWVGGIASPTDIIPIRMDLVDLTDVPEPPTLFMLSIGLAILVTYRARNQTSKERRFKRLPPGAVTIPS
jgi:hypothetical protein